MRLIFLGPPGAGKGTHATRCARAWQLAHISTGDLFRAEAKRDSALGHELASYMRDGALVPDSVVIALVEQRLAADDTHGGFILDGFPRTVAQATALDTALQQRQQAIQLAIYFQTSQEVILRRLGGRRACRACGTNYHVQTLRPRKAGVCDQCGGELYQRADDQPATIMKRLEIHQQESGQLRAYYESRGVLRDVDGNLEIDQLQPVLSQRMTSEGLLPQRAA